MEFYSNFFHLIYSVLTYNLSIFEFDINLLAILLFVLIGNLLFYFVFKFF